MARGSQAGCDVLRFITRLNVGGPLRQLEALCPGLAETHWRGPVIHGRVEPHETDGAHRLRERGVHLISLPGLARGIQPVTDLVTLRRALGVVRRLRPRILHSHTFKAGALARAVGRIEGIPTVHTFHGHHFLEPGVRGRAIRMIERGLIPAPDHLIALSTRQRRDLARVFGDSVPIHVISPGISLRALHIDAMEEVDDTPWSNPRAMKWIWTGRMVGVKRLRILLEALSKTKHTHELLLIGDGPERPAIGEAARAMGLEHLVMFAGALPIADVPRLVARADAFVLSSRSEGTPISVIEAMALGVPPVVPTVGGLPDVVAHERTGLWFAPGDTRDLARAMDRLATHPTLRFRLGAAAREAAHERFSAARLVADTCALYDEVAAGAHA